MVVGGIEFVQFEENHGNFSRKWCGTALYNSQQIYIRTPEYILIRGSGIHKVSHLHSQWICLISKSSFQSKYERICPLIGLTISISLIPGVVIQRDDLRGINMFQRSLLRPSL